MTKAQERKFIEAIQDRRTRNLLMTGLKNGMKVEVLSDDFRCFRIHWKGKSKVLFNDMHFFNPEISRKITKNKHVTKIFLAEKGISVPRGVFGRTAPEIQSKMKKEKINYPVVVKPIDSAAGIGVTVGIKNYEELQTAIRFSKNQIEKSTIETQGIFMAEEVVRGNDHRIFVIGNKLIACVKRVPGYVEGDGKHTIEQLIHAFNKTRIEVLRLEIDSEVRNVLKNNGLKLSSVLAKGQSLKLRKSANISLGGRSVDMTPYVSPRFKKIACEAVRTLGLYYGGVDLFVDDVTSDNPKQPYWIIEVNWNPGYDLHEKPTVEGKGVDVGKYLLEAFMEKGAI